MARAQTNIEPAALEAGLSKRLAARLGAFERRGVFISDVLLEVLVDEGEPQGLKRLLLSPLLNGDELPTPDFFAQLLAESDDGWLQDNPLQLITNGDVACIALADEAPQLELEGAASANNDDEPTRSESKALSVNNAANLPALKRGDAERVFGADALAQVKLTLLTSTNENEKIEAIRKLALSPLAGEEKLQLFLIALRDIARGVRAEASRGLGSLGLDGRIADNLARACQADEKERLVALSNLNQLLAHADQAEEALMVGVATGLLVSSESSPMISSALNLLEEIIRRSETLSDEVLTTLHRRIQELLLVPRPEVLRPLRRLYAALIERHAALVTSLIEASLEEVAPQHLRNFFLSVLLTSKDSGARSGANIRALIEAILSSDEIDPSFNHMRTALRELGADARDAVASVFESGNESRRVRLLETLADIIAAENAAQHTESLFELILDAFEDGSQRMRTAIYDSSVLRSEKLEGDQAQRAAALLLADIHEHELEATQEIVTGAILHLRGFAFEPTLNALETSPREVTIGHAARLLGHLATRWPNDAHVQSGVNSAIPRLLALLDSEEFPNRPVVYPALGQLCAHASADATKVKEIAERLHDEAGKSSATYDIIEALGWISAGDSIDDAFRLELVHVLLGFLELDLPKISGRIKQQQGEDVLEFGRETTAYTDLIPRLLNGFGRIIERENLTKGLWGLLVGRLSKMFEKVATYQIIWAPAATLALATILGRAGESKHASEREKEDVVELLLKKSNILSVVRVLGRLCMSDASPRMNHLASQVFERLDRSLGGEEDLEIAERRQILETFLALLRRESIGNDDVGDKRMRAQILDHIATGLKGRVVGLTDLVRRELNVGGFQAKDAEILERMVNRVSGRAR